MAVGKTSPPGGVFLLWKKGGATATVLIFYNLIILNI
jgi:hypothetical protein